MGSENIAYCFCVDADSFDARDKVAAVAFEENAVFGPVIVDVVAVPNLLEQCVVLGLGV
jgi:hypothetical protein